MKILDLESDKAVSSAQIYFTPEEARQFIESLSALLEEPEQSEHEHLFSQDGGCEISYSIVTSSKLANIESYTKREQRLLQRGK